jgi:hypothetical protein
LKKLFWIFAVVILFFVGDRGGGLVLKEMVSNSEFRYSKMYRGDADCDILFMGNSRGLGFYQPYIEEVTGKKTFNLSYNALPMNLGRVLLQDYLKYNNQPDLLVVDVTMMNRVDTTLISGFNVYTPYSDSLGVLVKQHAKNVFYAGKLSHLFLHNSEIFQRAMFYYANSDKDWIIDRVINENMVKKLDSEKPFYIGSFDSTTVNVIYDELVETVKIAKENNIRLKLVASPFYPDFVKKIVNFKEFKKRVEATSGLPLYDYIEAVQDPNGFGDYQHVNINGAKIYIDKMKADGIFD